jgi:hypothetical protein
MLIAAAGMVGAGLAFPAEGSISQGTVTPPGGFVQAGAYQAGCGCGLIPGQDLEGRIGTPQDFEEAGFSGNSSASVDAAFSSGTISNSGSGTAGLGFLRAQTFNSSPNNTFFATGAVTGGWKETFTVSRPDLNGMAGFMVFHVRVRGTMSATGATGAATVNTTGYKDNVELSMNALFNRGNSDPITTDRQRAKWGISGPETPPSRTVDDTVTMAAPITFGQPFTLGIYAYAQSGQRSSGSFPGIGTGTLDFSSRGVEWGGIASVMHDGAPISGFTVTSASGIDWVPELGEPCVADFNGDTVLNPDDLSEFITCFFLELQFPGFCAGGDFNGDGLINPDDLSEFITAFFLAVQLGC